MKLALSVILFFAAGAGGSAFFCCPIPVQSTEYQNPALLCPEKYVQDTVMVTEVYEPAVHGFVKRQYGRYVSKGGDGDDVLETRAKNVGYDIEFLKECGLNFEKTSVPQLFSSSCGSGCPVRLAPGGGIKLGSTLLDLGCGGKFD
jgi:hypothetical protein